MVDKIVPDTEENATRCLCPGCPTYNECMKNNNEHLYCSRGNTGCEFEEIDCLCGKCPVWKEYGIKSFYYCSSSLDI
ncbi:MAG: DUF2769 domain-containing protein [Methanobacterium sp.]